MRKSKSQGFTLIELIMVITIMAIITTFAIPSYRSYVLKANRNEAKVGLYDLAARMENYYDKNNDSYEGATITGVGGKTFTTDNHYQFQISDLTTNTYSLEAIAQVDDTLCGTLTLNQQGVEGETGSSSNPLHDCW